MDNIENLRKNIRRYATSYYEGNPEIGDDEFDALVEELSKLDPDARELHTQGWGYVPKGVLVKHKGTLPTIGRKFKPTEYEYVCCLPRGSAYYDKLDGVSAHGYYENGRLVSLITRGDGFEGYNIINKVNTSNIEKLIEDDGHAWFEVAISIADWEKNYDTEKQLSPRNLVAGICNKDNPEDWEIEIATPVLLRVLKGKLNAIAYGYLCGLRQTARIHEDLPEELVHGDYIIDGYVGEDIDHSLWAYKPEGQSAITTVKDIVWQQGKSGKLTPVLHIDPVVVSGSRISKVTGNSYGMLTAMKYGIGAQVKIIRSGQVIPKIVDVVKHSEEFNLPKEYALCGAHIFASNHTIDLLSNLLGSVSETKGIGPALVVKMLDAFEDLNVHDVTAILKERFYGFMTHHLTLREIEIVASGLEELKKLSMCNLIRRMNIPTLGSVGAVRYSEKRPLNSAQQESVEKYESQINQVVGAWKYAGFIVEESNLRKRGSVVVTGTFEVPRKELEKRLVDMGYEVVSAVKRGVILLEACNDGSGKSVKARDLGCRIVDSIEKLI